MTSFKFTLCLLLIPLCGFYNNITHAEAIEADVIVIVDTSISMKGAGMDPDHVSLLVARLFTDIVPGYLSVIRLPYIDDDQEIMLLEPTGDVEACQEGAFATECHMFKYKTGVTRAEVERSSKENLLGALVRGYRGEAQYKQQLLQHLDRTTMLNDFALSFLSAQGIFERHEKNNISLNKFIIWLSDGKVDDSDKQAALKRVVTDLQNTHAVHIEAIVFGDGSTALAESMNLPVKKSSSNHELMTAFAEAFRRIVGAPYEIDNLLSVTPRFNMKPNVEAAWVVIYGDRTLTSAYLDGPNGQIPANYAQDRWSSAGAYKVAYMQAPQAGQWTVHAKGGGAGVAYAVVQRSNLTPALLQPQTATANTPIALVAGVRADLKGIQLRDPELLQHLTLTAEFQGQTITLLDNGTQGDATAQDGDYSAMVTFKGAGEVPINLSLTSEHLSVARQVTTQVKVNGLFRYEGDPLRLDLGTLKVGEGLPESCVNLDYEAIHQGEVPFQMHLRRALPAAHDLVIRSATGTVITPDSKPIYLNPADKLQVCLLVSENAPSSMAQGEPWVNLQVAGSQAPEHQIELQLIWNVQGLSFWQRWGGLIGLILALLALLIIALGYILPQRFNRRLALSFTPDYEELDEQTPQPVKQWRGVGIGFYRNARAYLHANFRLSGQAQGALAYLLAIKGGTQVTPLGTVLYRETIDGEWETIQPSGQRIRAGDIYRIGDKGPYFRVTTR